MSALTTPQMLAQCPLSQSYLINAHDGTVREAGEMCGIRACSELLGGGWGDTGDPGKPILEG